MDDVSAWLPANEVWMAHGNSVSRIPSADTSQAPNRTAICKGFEDANIGRLYLLVSLDLPLSRLSAVPKLLQLTMH